jgi:hypothetical protein
MNMKTTQSRMKNFIRFNHLKIIQIKWNEVEVEVTPTCSVSNLILCDWRGSHVPYGHGEFPYCAMVLRTAKQPE